MQHEIHEFRAGRTIRRKWIRRAYLSLLLFVLLKLVSVFLGVAEFAQQLLDTVLFASIGLILHRMSKLPGLDLITSLRLDRLGGYIVLSVFIALIPLPLISLTAMVFSSVIILASYTLLSRLHYYATLKRRVRLKTWQ